MTNSDTTQVVLGRLTTVIDQLVALPVDDVDDLTAALKTVQDGCDRLEVVRAQLIAAARHRHARGRTGNQPDDTAGSRDRSRAQQRADRRQRDDLQDQLGMSGAEAARAQRAAKDLEDAPAVVLAALNAGQLRPDKARVIIDAARQLSDHPHLDALIAELLDAATRLDAIALGRLARRRVGELDPDQAAAHVRDQHRYRRAWFTTDTDGSVRFSGQVYGLAGERLLTAIRAFTRPDTPNTPRQPQQRTADALDDLAAAALDRAMAPTDHGQRPHLQITIPWHVLTARNGNVHTTHTATLPFTEIAHLLDDAVLSRCILDTTSTPIEVSTQTRTVPAGLWRALLARDRHCRWPGCDAPPAFCDVAHGPIPYRNGGRLTPNNAALLCRTHHRHFDNTRTTIHINGNHITFHPTNTSPPHTPETNSPPDTDPPPGRPPDPPNSPPPGRPPEPQSDPPDPPDHLTATLF